MSRDKLSPVVYGIETEYTSMIVMPDGCSNELVGECHSGDYQLGLYDEPYNYSGEGINDEDITAAINSLGLSIASSSGMLSNGSRFYTDVSGWEYATPECATAEDCAHRVFDGDSIVRCVLEYLRKKDIVVGYQLNRRLVDHNRSSRGVHLNLNQLKSIRIG